MKMMGIAIIPEYEAEDIECQEINIEKNDNGEVFLRTEQNFNEHCFLLNKDEMSTIIEYLSKFM